MKTILMLPLRIVFLPVMLLLKIVSLLTKGVVLKVSGLLTLFSFLLAILSVYAFYISIPQAGIVFIIGAILLSPVGVPMIAVLCSFLPDTLYHGLKKLIY